MSETFAVLAILIIFGIPVSLSDLKSKTIPNWLTGIFLIASIGFGFWVSLSGSTPILQLVISCVLSLSVYLVLYLLSRGSLGAADLKLAPGFGALLSVFPFIAVTWWILLTFVLAGIVSVILLATKRLGLKQEIAFAPFMFFAGVLIVLLSQRY